MYNYGADGPATAMVRLVRKTSVTPGTIRGNIRALVGRNPRRARILVPEVDRIVNVGRSGEFSIELEPGEYSLVVSAKRFRTQTKKIRLREGSTVILNVELHRK